jgi:hypothetical protein
MRMSWLASLFPSVLYISLLAQSNGDPRHHVARAIIGGFAERPARGAVTINICDAIRMATLNSANAFVKEKPKMLPM